MAQQQGGGKGHDREAPDRAGWVRGWGGWVSQSGSAQGSKKVGCGGSRGCARMSRNVAAKRGASGGVRTHDPSEELGLSQPQATLRLMLLFDSTLCVCAQEHLQLCRGR